MKQLATQLDAMGVFSILMEMVPQEISKEITESVSVPTIGIGAGPDCDGQVLVTHDILGLFDDYTPKFVKRYASLNESILDAVSAFKRDVVSGDFPAPEHSYSFSCPSKSTTR